jgi:hypothetical protein
MSDSPLNNVLSTISSLGLHMKESGSDGWKAGDVR